MIINNYFKTKVGTIALLSLWSIHLTAQDLNPGLGEEIKSKRDLFSKHYASDQQIKAVINAKPIHFLTKTGELNDIDTNIQNTNDFLTPYGVYKNGLITLFGKYANQAVVNRINEGEFTSFNQPTLIWEHESGQVTTVAPNSSTAFQFDKNRGSYLNIYPHINATFDILANERKLSYIIENADFLNQIPQDATYLIFSEIINLPIEWSVKENGGTIDIYDSNNKKLLQYKKPVIFDDAKKFTKIQAAFQHASVNGTSLTVYTKVPTSWLKDSKRSFPLTIDPTISAYPDQSEFKTGSVYSDGARVDNLIGFGRDENYQNAADYVRGFAYFNTTSIPDNATILPNVNVNFNIYDGSPEYSPGNGNSLALTQIPSSITPNATNGSQVFTTIGLNGYQPVVTAPLNTTGWKSHTLTSNAIVTDIQSQLVDNKFILGFMPQGNFNESVYLIAEGYSNDNPPYIIINYQEAMSTSKFETNLRVYPNPFQDQITIDTKHNYKNVNLYNNLGQLVLSQTSENVIKTNAIPTGVYHLKITFDDNKEQTIKLLKK